ncbi:hypothetical protein GQ53DRAFT_353230 [Thozetella sp. PMI_491]|nr:hypothetical protein GQ53DRAFT_353230 [Thozetella sp. PMI_491]
MICRTRWNHNTRIVDKMPGSEIGDTPLSQATTLREEPPAAEVESAPSPSSSARAKASSHFSFMRDVKDRYTGKRQEKEAAKKVDVYEKLYGFVPKNAMSEEEWERARKAAPKVKVPFQFKKNLYFGPRG